MIDADALLADLRKQVAAVEADLTQQVEHPDTDQARAARDRLRAEYDNAKQVGRTAATWNTWLTGNDKIPGRIPQIAVAWVLGTVFVRFCEDNHLITDPYLSGPTDERRDLAQARYADYVESDPNPTYRGWLERAFAEFGAGQAGKLLFDPEHNALYEVPLSHDAARNLVEFWRTRDEHGRLVHDFTDPLSEDRRRGWSTRFLGDLYEHLSEDARKSYALRQTPVFIEEFILDRTLKPALGEFGHSDLKLIDPTCGSGHFVLGAFQRLLDEWERQPLGKNLHQQVRAALDSVHGVDVNPFAIAIARVRLLIAAMAAAGVHTLADAARYEWPLHLAIGDSLIQSRQLELDYGNGVGGDPLVEFTYATEDLSEHPCILEKGRYHVVVGNPPYITVKDKQLNDAYRKIYPDVCSGKYALSVPFAARFFELAKRGSEDGRGYGRVGQITSNSFMKREFGTKLIEKYFAEQVELTEVIDTSGVFIPGHGTPTVILVGTPRSGDSRTSVVRTVRSVQGEPKEPKEPENGLVWREIVEQINNPGFAGKWISVDDLDRTRYFSKQPWILLDGGLEMVEQIEQTGQKRLRSLLPRDIGFASFPGQDDAFISTPDALRRTGIGEKIARWLIIGEVVRDWNTHAYEQAVVPYDLKLKPLEYDSQSAWGRLLWQARSHLRSTKDFDGKTQDDLGKPWWAWYRWVPERYLTPLSITFAFVATHNHFVLDRGKNVFKQSAPVIKLPHDASEEAHLQLLGPLNSSTACFWLKMVSQDKPSNGVGRGLESEKWTVRYEFTGTNLEEFPLPQGFAASLAKQLDKIAQNLSAVSPEAICAKGVPTATVLREAKHQWHELRARMISLQEELDWYSYSAYGLLPDQVTIADFTPPGISLGERAFEILLARQVVSGGAETEWFRRHNSPLVTEIPAHWPDQYRDLVQSRIRAIESGGAIGMIERPEYKRRWLTEGWDALQDKAIRAWLLDRLERRELWYDEDDQPAIRSLARLTDLLAQDEVFASVVAIYAPRQDLAKTVADLITEEHVPFLAALRYKPSGLKKWADWEHVWDLQRQEDSETDLGKQKSIRDSIPLPPKYGSTDFLRDSYWKARGKLDMPKERFISYGETNVATPQRYGWAGWDHRERAQALATYFTTQALDAKHITPPLAGLLELQPWLEQWHNEFDDDYSASPAAFFAGYRRQIQSEHGLTDDELRAWTPPKATRGRGTRKTTKTEE
ncbi:BREX-2 system adenine-specific DNA-methyltransferase PglX [Nocardia sp. NPDC049737]|uniref:BREX-2 system adenine-specific DNA-methyltransferase PglX n=1 Tax=Nocardia sp. NPDC049737 TaxID=3154358 RepID=UPI003414D33F